MPSTNTEEQTLISLIHDLRQPIANLETSLYFLNLVLKPETGRVREQLEIMEHQVAEAAELLEQAGAELRELRAQRASTGSLPLTNSASAGVT